MGSLRICRLPVRVAVALALPAIDLGGWFAAGAVRCSCAYNFAGLGAYCFLLRRRWASDLWPAAIAAGRYPLTGFFIFWKVFMPHRAVAFLPWILLAVEETRVRHGAGRARLAFFTGIRLLWATRRRGGSAAGLGPVCRLPISRSMGRVRAAVATGTSALGAGGGMGLGARAIDPHDSSPREV